MENARIKLLRHIVANTDSESVTIEISDLTDLLDTAEYANKAAWILDSLPVDMDDMLEGYDAED
jgi:hypothetical protein